jgi:LAGLIDADG endonuclease
VQPATDETAAFIGGFVAAEGTFVCSGDPPKFTFAVALGAADSDTCIAIQDFLGAGYVHEHARRKAHYDDEVTFAIQSMRQHLEVTIPFMDEHLPPSYKREQYLDWRKRLLDYWEHRAKRVRPCEIEGCEKPRRAHGLCRGHLYVFHGV